MRWTPQMEECLRSVEANKACPTDETLALQVRLQLLAQKAAQAREQNQVAGMPSSPLPLLFYDKALRMQLQELMQSPRLQQQSEKTFHLQSV